MLGKREQKRMEKAAPPGSQLSKTNIPTDSDKFKSLAASPWYAKLPQPNFTEERDKSKPSESKLKKREAKKMLKRIKAELDLLNN